MSLSIFQYGLAVQPVVPNIAVLENMRYIFRGTIVSDGNATTVLSVPHLNDKGYIYLKRLSYYK